MEIFNLKGISTLFNMPKNSEEFNEWIQQKDIYSYLEKEIQDEHIILYASLPQFFIHSALIPYDAYNDSKINDLLGWSCDPYSSWSQVLDKEKIWFEPPLSNSNSEILSKGEQILFARSFESVKSLPTYYELNQKIAHLLNIHFLSEKNAWCNLNEFGDIEEVVKIIEGIKEFNTKESSVLVVMKKSLLGEYASLADSILIRMFDFTRCDSKNFSGWSNIEQDEIVFDGSKNIFGRLKVIPYQASFSRGIQLADIKISKNQILKKFWAESETKKQYAEYIAHDIKNNVITTISCNPSCLANYYTESDLPFEMTPAFFRAEVLAKYKSDTDKYILEERSINCRGTWHLKTFDRNKAGQIHTYLIYLSYLPYEEQLHWKQYNEKPKASLSSRAIKTDFIGDYDDEYIPLRNIKQKLLDLDKSNVSWWKLRDKDILFKVHYPYTDSKDEWANELLNLDQFLIEGFEEKLLRKQAEKLGGNLNELIKLRTLKLIEICLVLLNVEEKYAKKIMEPFHELHNLRSKVKSHNSGKEANKLKLKALKEFGSFYNHYESLCKEFDESLEIIINVFNAFE